MGVCQETDFLVSGFEPVTFGAVTVGLLSALLLLLVLLAALHPSIFIQVSNMGLPLCDRGQTR